MTRKVLFLYVGNGDWIWGVPRRDLDVEDWEKLKSHGWTEERLLETGLYQLAPDEPIQPKIKKHKEED